VSEREQLLLKIVRCAVAQSLVGKTGISHGCSAVVAEQKVSSWENFQVPEPWSGHLGTARILFLSSNPSISGTEAYPTGRRGDAELVNFFDGRFDGYWVKDGKFARNDETARQATGKAYGDSAPFWANIKNRAEELIPRAVPGKDYALSEVVHCKSIMAAGVDAAIATCGSNYLGDVLASSGAKVLVLVGKKALRYWNSLPSQMGMPYVPEKGSSGPHEVAGRQRYCIYLPAPSAVGGAKKFENLMEAVQLQSIRHFLV
jgi:hypothetical protein